MINKTMFMFKRQYNIALEVEQNMLAIPLSLRMSFLHY